METLNISEIHKRLNQIEKSMVTRQELVQAIETMAIFSNENTMSQIRNSERDISKNNFKEINSVEDI